MVPTVQSILYHSFPTYGQTHRLPPGAHHAVQAMAACRTAALGGHCQRCPDGHVARVWYNSCKQRSCPQCAALQQERWLQKTQTRLLACPHYHTIFTIPHQLHALWLGNTDRLPGLLFSSVRDTLLTLLKDDRYLGATPGLMMTLHTWGRTLSLHPHIHCLVTAGGSTAQGTWKTTRPDYLLPVRVVKALFRGKLLAMIRSVLSVGTLRLPEGISRVQLQTLLNRLGRVEWNVRIQGRYAHGQGVLTYLARYVRGGPLRNSQLLQADKKHVTFRYTDHRDGRTKPMTLPNAHFIQRLLWHVPEPGQHRIRYGGLYAGASRGRLDHARQSLGQAPVPSVKPMAWTDYMEHIGQPHQGRCPVCNQRLIHADFFPAGGIPPPIKKEVVYAC